MKLRAKILGCLLLAVATYNHNLLAQNGKGQQTYSLEIFREETEEILDIEGYTYFANPSVRNELYGWNRSNIRAGYGSSKGGIVPRLQDVARYAPTRDNVVSLHKQEGNGYRGAEAAADMAQNISDSLTTWGNVNYQHGERLDAQWNETSDYGIVAPYVVADTVCGSLKREAYGFQAGFSREAKHFNYGVQIGYSSSIEHRESDPRPKNNSLLAKASLGISRSFSDDLGVGLYIQLNKYAQEQNIKFFNAYGGTTIIYQMEGLGNTYHRFSQSNDDAAYKGRGVCGGLTLKVGGKTKIGIQTGHSKIEKLLPDKTNIVINTKETNELTIDGCNTQQCELIFSNIRTHLRSKLAKVGGTEIVYGTNVGNYKQIAEVKNYSEKSIHSVGDVCISFANPLLHKVDIIFRLEHDFVHTKHSGSGSDVKTSPLMRTLIFRTAHTMNTKPYMFSADVFARGRSENKHKKIDIRPSQVFQLDYDMLTADYAHQTSRLMSWGFRPRVDYFDIKHIRSIYAVLSYEMTAEKTSGVKDIHHAISAHAGISF